jgi:hypothetical protein
MRVLLLSIGILGLFATAARADDAAAVIVGAFPPNTNAQQVYIFKLKDNDITVRITPDEFCSQLGYGQAAKYHHGENGKVQTLADQGNDEIDENGKRLPGTLNWVVCQFPKTK